MNSIELYIILKLESLLNLRKIHIWRLFGGFVMQGHKLNYKELNKLNSELIN